MASLVVGLWSGHRVYGVLTTGDAVQMTAGELESGAAGPGLWNEVSGVLLLDTVHVHRSRRSTIYYIPLVSSGWKRGDDIAVVARFGEIPQEAVGVFRGITPTHHGVPSSVAQGMADAGLFLAGNCLLLKADETPGSAAAMQSVGVLIALFGFGFAVYKWPVAGGDKATK